MLERQNLLKSRHQNNGRQIFRNVQKNYKGYPAIFRSNIKTDSALRSKASKEVIIKDLRMKISELESKIEIKYPSPESADGGALELKHRCEPLTQIHSLALRLQIAEEEKARLRGRLTSFQTKLLQSDRKIESLTEEIDVFRKSSDNVESLRQTIAKKDALIRSQKESIKKSREDIVVLEHSFQIKKNEMEKQIRSAA